LNTKIFDSTKISIYCSKKSKKILNLKQKLISIENENYNNNNGIKIISEKKIIIQIKKYENISKICFKRSMINCEAFSQIFTYNKYKYTSHISISLCALVIL